jgi:hypothetical protein
MRRTCGIPPFNARVDDPVAGLAIETVIGDHDTLEEPAISSKRGEIWRSAGRRWRRSAGSGERRHHHAIGEMKVCDLERAQQRLRFL